jgi:hypothetical protein
VRLCFVNHVLGEFMNTSRRILTGLVLGTGLIGSACTTIPRPVAVNAAGAEDACEYAQEDYAPQIMVYDSSTGTETHVDANGTQSTLAVRNVESHRGGAVVGADTATRSDARSGYICSAAFGPVGVEPGRGGINPVLVGATAGAVTGALVTKRAGGAAEGAVIGGSMISTFADPIKGRDVSVGSAVGAVVGAAVTHNPTAGAAAGAATGAVLGNQVYDGTSTARRHDREDDEQQ